MKGARYVTIDTDRGACRIGYSVTKEWRNGKRVRVVELESKEGEGADYFTDDEAISEVEFYLDRMGY